MTDSPTPYREAVARIIDPDAWAYFDADAGQHNGTDLLRFDRWKQSSLAKADTILALREDQPSVREALARVLEMLDTESAWAIKRNAAGEHVWVPNSGGVYQKAREALSASPVIKGGGLGAVDAHPSDGKRLSAGSEPSCPQQPIETAPKDGTLIDLWVHGVRWPDCHWGRAQHSCGEAGQYCDSDWHRLRPSWIDSALDQRLGAKPTHWQPRPAPPVLATEPQPLATAPDASAVKGSTPLSADAGASCPWRPEVRAFADLMEAQLRANDHKPGWKGESPQDDLLPRLYEEAGELKDALSMWFAQICWGEAALYLPGNIANVGREAADVANFAMMIADVCGALPSPAKPLSAEGEETATPEPPWEASAYNGNNAKREGWSAFFAGRSREACPFPAGRSDLQRGYREGWDAAKVAAPTVTPSPDGEG